MTPWHLGSAANLVSAAVCRALAAWVFVPLVGGRRRGVNRLALAAAGILLAVGLHHAGHAVLSADRPQAFGDGAWGSLLAVSDVLGMMAGLAYLVLRRRDGLVGPGQLFADLDTQRNLSGEQAALREVAVAVAEERPPDEIFGLVARTVSELFDVECGLVTRFEPTGTRVVGTHGQHRSQLGVLFPLEGDTALPRVAATGMAARTCYRDHPDDHIALHVRGQGYERGVAAPVWVGARLWGAVLIATTRRDALTASDIEDRLTRFAELVALAIANADSRARLTEQAANDPLTGLANHRTFHERLSGEVSRARRHMGSLSVLVLDIDHFKSVNDTHGHRVGDEVLSEVARRIRGEVRTEDLVARIGGEEFAVLAPATGEREALHLAERIRQAVRETPFAGVGRVTLSVGVCALERARDQEELLRLADGALYWAKANGRDRAVRYAPEVVRSLSAGERAEELLRTRALAALGALALAIDAKDHTTREHSERVAEVAAAIGAELGWSTAGLVRLRQAGLLHDVGKIGVADRILGKDGPLSRSEEADLAEHAVLGGRILGGVLDPEQVLWVRHHHERWTGGGYPDGLSGEAIPLGARILAVADAWDALTGANAGRIAGPLADSPDLCCGRFDPDVVDALARVVARGRRADEAAVVTQP